MKHYHLILTILLAGLFSCQTNKHEVIINGKILGEVPRKIEYTLPIDGVSSFAFKDSVQADSLGNFTIKIEIEKPVFVKILIPMKMNAPLLIEAGMDYDVVFNLAPGINNFEILSENRKGQDAYKALPNPGHAQIGARDFLKDSVASDIKSKIKTLRDNEIAQFDTLLSNGDISDGFYQLVKMDREVYYATIQGTVALIKKYEDLRLNNGIFSPEIKQMWKESFAETTPTSNNLMRSPWYFPLVENYILCKEYTDESFDYNKLKETFDKGLRHTHSIEEAKKYLSSTMLEYYTASYLYNEAIQKQYEKELISLFEDFKKDFPNSEYTRHIEPLIDPIVDFHKKKDAPYSKDVHFIPDYENINSLSESVKSLKGRKVYVDVWATWCGPCKKEFEHKAQLKELLASNDMEILYISIDDDRSDTKWKEMIKFYNLEGHHIRANEKFVKNLREIFNQDGSISIPWYIIIDENGKIMKEHASRPSQIKDLEKEINDN